LIKNGFYINSIERIINECDTSAKKLEQIEGLVE